MRFLVLYILLGIFLSSFLFSGDSFLIGRLHYDGGGDWYSNPSSLPNLSKFCSKHTKLKFFLREQVVSLKNDTFKSVPVIYFTGHGKFVLSSEEKKNLRWYLKNGGFLFADDNYGMHIFIQKEMNHLLKGVTLQEIPISHKIFRTPFSLTKGLPKIHKHYGGRAVPYGLFFNQKLVAFYGYNTDLGDGWEDIDIHKNSISKHKQALKMGCNVLYNALSQDI